MEHTKILPTVRKHWLAILLFALAVGVGAYLVTKLCCAPQYQSQATFAVAAREEHDLSDTARMAEVFAELFNSRLMDKIAGKASVLAAAVPETNLVSLTVTAPDAQTAFLTAQAVIERHVEVTSRVVEDAFLEVLQSPNVPAAPVSQPDAVGVMLKAFLLAALAACAGVIWLSAPKEEEDKLDLLDILRQVGRLWRVGLALVLVCGLLLGVHAGISYQPEYEASATFAAKAEETQIGKTLANILTSSLVESRVMEELGISRMPEVSVSLLPKSGVITLTLRDEDPRLAYDVLNAMLEECTEIAEGMVGDTALVLLENSGLPMEPVNARNIPAATLRGAALGLGAWLALALIAVLHSTTSNDANKHLEDSDNAKIR